MSARVVAREVFLLPAGRVTLALLRIDQEDALIARAKADLLWMEEAADRARAALRKGAAPEEEPPCPPAP